MSRVGIVLMRTPVGTPPRVAGSSRALFVGVAIWAAVVFVCVQATNETRGVAVPQTQSAATMVDYERQVKPIFEASCLECHSEYKRKGGLSLASYADVLDGGRSGAVVRPGHAST